MTGKGTKRQSIRCDDDIWLPFVAKAEREGTTASAKLREFMVADLERGKVGDKD